MQNKYNNFNLLETIQLTELECKKHLAFSRWGNTTICPYCNHDKCYTTKTCYKCAKCRRVFNVTVGTIFHNSKVPLRKWFAAIYLITAHKKGISSYQLGRDIDVTQKTAWFMLHRIRHTLSQNGYLKLSGTIEADETFIGGKNRNRHWNKKVKYSQGRSVKDKTPVFGMLERNGKLRAQKVSNTKGRTLQPIILENVKRGSKIMTDEWGAYNDLKKYFHHRVVNHRRGQYVTGKYGEVHVNALEGFWSLFKRGILGIYHNVSPKHLDNYIKEFVFRYNNRKGPSEKRFKKVLQSKKQLTFKNLTKGQR